ncbi:unnamed protein product [Arabis nemorensis]|uniref:Uncharacterized protein n=1 Tax=Arabis nemorensis TaxID=586526 RepID=A0A565CQA0_9BRAS|nr:unnamed protein product [Arabis nemorensis]
MSTTRKSPKLPADCSEEEFERGCEFLRKVKEIDNKRKHSGVFLQYIIAMKLYQSGSLNAVDVKKQIATTFRNCDVLLAGFERLLQGLSTGSRRDDVVTNPSNLKRILEFLKMLSSNCRELRGGLIESLVRFEGHADVEIFKEEVDLLLRDYPCLKEEFRMILVDHGVLRDDH